MVAYATLRAHPDLDLEGFAARLGLGVPEAKELLDRLVDLTLVRRNDESGQLVVPASPLAAMQQIIERERAALDARRRSLEESYEMLTGVFAELPGGPLMPSLRAGDAPVADPPTMDTRVVDPPPQLTGTGAGAERIEGLDAVRQRLQGLADMARHEILSFAPPARNSSAARAASRRPDLEVLARGVVTRTLYVDSIVGEPEALRYAQELVAAGAKVRLVPNLPIRLIIVDHRIAAVPIDPQDGTVGALIVHETGTVSAMVALFEAYWRMARPMSAGPDDGEFSAMEIATLRLLASGAKDEAVARQLGVSVRTIRRAIASLMERLHAESRFELGTRAAERGLLGPPPG
jgi:DNA-binding CsgD family transcriptional regulator